MKGFTLEVCANSVQSAINAQIAGAKRIELCENLFIGGTTPSYGCIKTTRERVDIAINILIRPRIGDFLYSDIEFEQIKNDILVAKQLGVNGIVCGILLPNGEVDTERTDELVELSKPLTFTFHRAFDFTPDPYKALEDIIKTGATHILTSGQKNKAADSVDLLYELVKKAANRVVIMPGSGINADTIKRIVNTGANEFHMSGVKDVESKMIYRKENLTLNGNSLPDYVNQISDVESIKMVVEYLNLHF
ncbi:MAG TPA: copper homeostasis protein CutC [Tenuifilaceae bacterium]|nr:copper homeostasis protein CutC [Tenuifilaceae bacterium]HOZ14584.1 copper homeostasis protein CutC [Tenuifilaceae bacterium]HPI46496.1 copper homeostasis protein CutC [Tenuifilaceae bacterium]HPN20790.1 copper homeostasis protein CutC [Tenuifilaceae bacterium]